MFTGCFVRRQLLFLTDAALHTRNRRMAFCRAYKRIFCDYLVARQHQADIGLEAIGKSWPLWLELRDRHVRLWRRRRHGLHSCQIREASGPARPCTGNPDSDSDTSLHAALPKTHVLIGQSSSGEVPLQQTRPACLNVRPTENGQRSIRTICLGAGERCVNGTFGEACASPQADAAAIFVETVRPPRESPLTRC